MNDREISDPVTPLAAEILVEHFGESLMFGLYGTSEQPFIGSTTTFPIENPAALKNTMSRIAKKIAAGIGAGPPDPGPLIGYGMRLEARIANRPRVSADFQSKDARVVLDDPHAKDVVFVWIATRWKGFWWIELDVAEGTVARYRGEPDEFAGGPHIEILHCLRNLAHAIGHQPK
ncbi:hypothetical protein ACIBCN_18930 [Nocardia sp. NPDC051052]|uniref:hypothetical protein n=1 Tax=Nocardia sp. NPDC051052 TaxID=3364322 RepID=UPI0037A9A06F